jgi:CBS-domain-containing membrane protein
MNDLSIQHVYSHGGESRLPIDVPARPTVEARVPTASDLVPLHQIMTREVVCVRDDLLVETAIELAARRRLGCLPVVDRDGFPTGIVTKQDLLEAAANGDALEIGQVMMPIAFTLGDRATIAHAAAMMVVEGVHHVPIVGDDGRLVGVVSSLDIVRWLAENDGLVRT